MNEATLRALTVADTAALQCALALMIGSLASRWWLRRATSAWAHEVVRLSRRSLLVGIVLAIASDLVSVWLPAVVMLDDPSASVGPMIAMVLRETHFGTAWWFGATALLAALLATPLAAGVTESVATLAVAVFAASRSVVSHAGGEGDFTWKVGVDWVHLLVVCLWVGIVLVGAVVVLHRSPRSRADGVDAVRWVSALSDTATVALLVVVVTGLLKVWWATPTVPMLVASTYGRVLAIKLFLVSVAVALGGFNRFRTLPGLLGSLVDPEHTTETFRGRFAHVVRLEAAVLLCAVIAAAVLSGTATPGEG